MSESKAERLSNVNELIYNLKDLEKDKTSIALVSLMRTLDMYAYKIEMQNAYVSADIIMKDNKPIFENLKYLERPSRLSKRDIDNVAIFMRINKDVNPDSFNCLRIQILVLHKHKKMINMLEDEVVIKGISKMRKI